MGIRSATNLSRSGVSDWIIQRVSAVILAVYIVFVVGYVIVKSPVNYEQWVALFSCTVFKVFTLLMLLSLIAHAWIGLWTIATDYLHHAGVRFLFLLICALTVFVYLVWGIIILWGAPAYGI